VLKGWDDLVEDVLTEVLRLRVGLSSSRSRMVEQLSLRMFLEEKGRRVLMCADQKDNSKRKARKEDPTATTLSCSPCPFTMQC